jgi:hypothetical protein
MNSLYVPSRRLQTDCSYPGIVSRTPNRNLLNGAMLANDDVVLCFTAKPAAGISSVTNAKALSVAMC